ncbi:nte family protein [Acrodontium crateriforme]|uniref:Patatin-like phospholipase domain-containing protein n=1 Tax=Acrodontium crateriforme TaxID=150365 RepID=A0AAQ3M0D7_9PEZI|nr:nte family protein [Acrodontium crateriforme]
MQVPDNTRWARAAGLGHATGRPEGPRRLRTSKSHASILQPFTRSARDVFAGITSLADSLTPRLDLGYGASRNPPDETTTRKLALYVQLRKAESCAEWQAAAKELDELEGNDEWKNKLESDEYDYELVKARLEALESAAARGDLHDMCFHIRTALARDLGGMGEVTLYKHSHTGTKVLIERYINAVIDTINAVVEATGYGPTDSLNVRYTMEKIKLTRQAFGRSALLLSGGGTLGMNHIGVVKALFEAKLLPRIISGASAGSIVCAVMGTKTDAEIPEVLQQFCYGDLAVFTEVGKPFGWPKRLLNLVSVGAIYDIDHLVRIMQELLGDLTFQEAHNRTQRILNICVSSPSLYELPRLLNYVTAPNVLIWSAVAASCSVPLVFTGAKLHVKDPVTKEIGEWDESASWIDGSVDNDLPMTRLAEMFNVNHFIVSQVNPHVVPFLSRDEDDLMSDLGRPAPAVAPGPGWLRKGGPLAQSEVLHRMHVTAEVGIFPNIMTKGRSILGQKYSGDINILPDISYAQFPSILSNPTVDFMVQAMSNGERATWPKLSRIQNHLAIELALDDAFKKLTARATFSPSQVDLRMNMFAHTRSSVRGRRRGSKGSHKSARSAVLPRIASMRQRGHRPIRSLVDPIVPGASQTTDTTAADEESAIGDSTWSSEDEASSASPSSNGDQDEDLGVTDTTFDSPPSPEPESWWSKSRSQPTTPSIGSRGFLVGSPSAPGVHTPVPRSNALTMTSKSAMPSSPERSYRNLFRSVRPMSNVLSRAPTTNNEDQLGETSNAKNVAQEPPNRMRLKKRSLSTGLKGLRPPQRQ